MSNSWPIGLTAALLALATTAAHAAPPVKAPVHTAPSADRYAVQASYRTAELGRGYSARARQIADCLAAYRHDDRASGRHRASHRCDL